MKLQRILSLGAVAATVAVAGCQTGLGGAGRLPPPPAIEGDWVGAEGITSNFQNGVFQTRATDTGEVLASGTYAEQPGGVVRIDVQSRVRASQTVNCLKVGAAGGGRFNQMNCSSSNGSQFTLVRAGVAS